MPTERQALPEAADAARLTTALRRSGAIADDTAVAGVEVAWSRTTILSRIIRLLVRYENHASGQPASLILKTRLTTAPGEKWQVGRREVAFYRGVAPATPVGLVPSCFAADWQSETGDWHVLLEDLSDTHFVSTTWPLPPSLEHCGRIIDARARFHAAWWDDPRLGRSVGSWPDPQELERHLSQLHADIATVAGSVGGHLITPERRDLFMRLLDAAPSLLAGRRSRSGLTVVHGDAHAWNCFLPRDPASNDVRLFDWDAWRPGVAATDLAYMMAMHWYPDLRRQAERPLLDRYHATLLQHGVRNYDRRALTDDYRVAALWLTTLPIQQAAGGIPPVVWWNNLERLLLAIDDLHCRDVLA